MSDITPPRYDDVYFEALAKLDELASPSPTNAMSEDFSGDLIYGTDEMFRIYQDCISGPVPKLTEVLPGVFAVSESQDDGSPA